MTFDPTAGVYLDLDETLQSNVPGVYVAGDLTGFPLLKTAINQGVEIVERIAAEPRAEGETLDLLIVGAGAAGLSAALRAKELGLRFSVLEQGRIASTIVNFPAGKPIFAEPEGVSIAGSLFLAETTKEALLERWESQIAGADLPIRTGIAVTGLRAEPDGRLMAQTATGETLTARRVLLAIGKRGNPRRLGVPGEDLPHVRTELLDPGKHRGEEIVIVGGGDSAVEAALALCENNRVTLLVRGDALTRPKQRNRERAQEAQTASRLTIRYKAQLNEITERAVLLKDGTSLPAGLVFTMLGADPPLAFLRKIGIRTRGAWTPARWGWFAMSSLFFLALYGIYRFGAATPLVGGLAPWLARVPGGWYGLLYTLCVLGFGLHALLRPRARHLRYHGYIRARTLSAIFVQVVLYFLVPLFVLKGVPLAQVLHLWPLSIDTLTPEQHSRAPWVFWSGLGLSFVGLPVLVYFHGKRYCSFVCGCGALAETLGDATRDLAPRGRAGRRWEFLGYGVLAWAFGYVLWKWLRVGPLAGAHLPALDFLFGGAYGFLIAWLWAGLVGVGAYFFFGNRIWCRYGCPLAWLMNLYGKVGLKSRFAIVSNERCIDCGQCNRYCQMGIDVKGFAMAQRPLTLSETPCIGCGECLAVCPMDVLSFGDGTGRSGSDGLIRSLPVRRKGEQERQAVEQ
jgi:thioredoxin reductase/NAD-dependent dihydropyrimidine dehydrogenase PreA subunit